jgi:alkylated DNA repair dioxygenase AlkB
MESKFTNPSKGKELIFEYYPDYLTGDFQESLLSEVVKLPFGMHQAGDHDLSRSTMVLMDRDVLDYKSLLPMYWGNNVASGIFGEKMQLLKQRLIKDFDMEFNICLLNHYSNGKQNINWHSDREENGDTKVIASVSLGSTRTFQLKHQDKLFKAVTQVKLISGSLFIMRDPCQSQYYHRITKDLECTTSRYNLTFRKFNYNSA